MARVLGERVAAPKSYAPEVLEPISRAAGRANLSRYDATACFGSDVWHCYELSWLGPHGRPDSCAAVLSIPSETPNTVESKSLKLYLNSLNFKVFESREGLLNTIRQDLAPVLGAIPDLQLVDHDDLTSLTHGLVGRSIDTEVARSPAYGGCDPRCIEDGAVVAQLWYSHNLRSLCPVTGQPDWATLVLDYSGQAWDMSTIADYLLGFREHQEFHEQCVERIFSNLMACCEPDKLTVSAFYQRRGGIDITPWRSNTPLSAPGWRLARQ
jgi:7-cyano-7-deazaguanine reductase